MKHFVHFVRPGATVLGVSGSWAGNAAAFRNPDGRQVCVIQNPAAEVRALTVEAGSVRAELTLPPRSIQTWVAG